MKPRRRFAFRWLAIALAHYAATLGCLLYSMGATMARFDTGGDATVIEKIAAATLNVLSSPVVPLLRLISLHLAGAWDNLALFANSALWATAIVVWLGRGRKAQPVAAAGTEPAKNVPDVK